MNINRSFLKNSLKRQNTKTLSFIDYQPDIIDDNLKNSYFIQTIEKKKTAPQQLKLEKFQNFNNKSQILKNESTERKYQIYKSVLKSQIPTKGFYRVLMSNIGELSQGLSCCNQKGVRQPVLVYIGQYKDIRITDLKQKMIHQLNFNTISVQIQQSQIDPSSFILNVSKQIILKFQSYQNENISQVTELKARMEKIIYESLGKKFPMEDLKQIQDFHRRKYVSAIQFAQNCETGDILLFRGNLFWAKAQRFFTKSDYDHVGMVYKDPIHGILLFQATSFNGICLSPWQYVVKYKWYRFIQRITWRKLYELQRSDQFLQQMQILITQKLGKAYHISIQKLMINVSYVQPPSNKKIQSKQAAQQKKNMQNPKQQKAGYYCSQLIAKMYKDLDLLTKDTKDPNYKPSNNTYPYHFTQKFQMPLKKGKLGDQCIIHFHPDSISEFYGFD